MKEGILRAAAPPEPPRHSRVSSRGGGSGDEDLTWSLRPCAWRGRSGSNVHRILDNFYFLYYLFIQGLDVGANILRPREISIQYSGISLNFTSSLVNYVQFIIENSVHNTHIIHAHIYKFTRTHVCSLTIHLSIIKPHTWFHVTPRR